MRPWQRRLQSRLDAIAPARGAWVRRPVGSDPSGLSLLRIGGMRRPEIERQQSLLPSPVPLGKVQAPFLFFLLLALLLATTPNNRYEASDGYHYAHSVETLDFTDIRDT